MYLGYLDTVRVPEHPHPLPLTRHFTPNPTISKYPCYSGHFSSFINSMEGRSHPYRGLFYSETPIYFAALHKGARSPINRGNGRGRRVEATPHQLATPTEDNLPLASIKKWRSAPLPPPD